jgi:amino acid transporter
MAFWITGYFWKRTGWLRTSQMDVDTGRRELDWDLINREREEMKTWPAWKRLSARIF